jgi:hypothetical protein
MVFTLTNNNQLIEMNHGCTQINFDATLELLLLLKHTGRERVPDNFRLTGVRFLSL